MSDKRIWELLDLLSIREEPEDAIRKARSLDAIRKAMGPADPKGPPGGSGPGRKRRAAFLAFGLLLLLVGLGGAYYYKQQASRPGTEVAETFDMVDTRAQSRTCITLPDSSRVILNGACRFGYNKQFGLSKREMILKGEAWFDIHRNPDMPLLLTAGNVRIRVLGTSFNVKAYSDDSFVEATLLKGAIEISLKSDPERAILLRPGEKIVIQQSDTLLSEQQPRNSPSARHNSNDVIAVTKVQVDPADSSLAETAWLKDKMVFRKESFESLAKRMERWYNVKIVFADPNLSNLVFTGSFEKEDIRHALGALQNSSPFHYSINDGVVNISSH